MPNAPSRFFRRFSWVLQVVGQIVLVLMVVTVTYDTLMRYVFAAPTSWILEINAFLLVYLAVMTAADTERRGEHINISLMGNALGGRWPAVLSVAIGIAGIAFCAILAWLGGVLAVDAWRYGDRVSSAFGTPTFLPYAMLPVGFGVLGIQFLIGVVRAFERPRRADDGSDRHA